MALTVLMPVYNAASTVVEAARSILDDAPGDVELLCIDDGSTDGSGDLLRALRDRRVRVLEQENAGTVAALNRGLDEASGDLVARMDADDVSLPGRLAAQVRWHAENPDGVICGTDYELSGAMTGRVRMPRSDAACRHRLLLASCFCGASVMIRKQILDETGIRFDPAYTHCEEYDVFTRLAEHGRLGNVPMVGYRYLIHPGQVSDLHRDVQRAHHRRTVDLYSDRIGASRPAAGVLDALLWPEPDGVGDAVRGTGAAALRAVVRDPGVETVRFSGRKLVEAVAAARRR